MSNQYEVLIVDDDDMVRDSIAMVLARNHCNTATASSAQAGLELCDQKTFDVILTDLVMPEMDGVEFITALRKKGIGTPIVTLTGGVRVGSQNLSAAAIEAGASIALKKPVNKQQLLDAIEKALT
ncbi:putative Response regulator receiver domain [Candidatus Terasakiella magnetica]|uniref:Putative Response regulator receiver domain n=1 Tax=Candidatus Terasakiella magnetica TaxID=1867952 RepID=A0A1C3RC78_9PROT|nr:response regulator [Candidatus Terasakiella magnetica]SCA54886.1 putative Response regulator receiver domain [Candidatus Terasakiella magnetica]